ncbi:MAG: hypothetical protein ACYC1M_17980 [Armatimonadota bacterium]
MNRPPKLPNRLPRCEIKRRNGMLRVTVNGKGLSGMAYCYQDPEDAERAYKAGVRLFTFGMSMGNEQQGVFNSALVDFAFVDLARRMPGAYLLPRVMLNPPQWWSDKHPDQACIVGDGKKLGMSYASELWRKEIGEQLSTYLQHISQAPYSDMVIGITLCAGESGEWQAWGLNDWEFGDLSTPNTMGYREWLKKNFSLHLLESLLGKGVKSDTVNVPPTAARRVEGSVLFHPDPAVALYYQYHRKPVADSILHFARVSKQATDRRMLVGVYYGYEIQYASLAQESQHLAMQRVAESHDVDMMYSPALYDNRAPGGTSAFMSCTESILNRGKLWFNESDNRSYLSGTMAGTYKIPGMAETREDFMAVMEREYGHTVSRGTGQWWFDVPPGSYKDTVLASLFTKMEAYRQSVFDDPQAAKLLPEIAFLVDEDTPCFMTPVNEFLGRSFFDYFSRLPTLGAPYGIYLMSDAAKLPESVKLVVVVNAYRLTRRQTDTLGRLGRPGRSIMWLYAPGLYEASEGAVGKRNPARMSVSTGIRLEMDDTARPLLAISTISKDKTPFGVGTGQPVIWSSDGDAKVLANYADTGRAAVVMKDRGGWCSVWSGVPNPAVPLLREIARKAGVHIYNETGDTFYAGNGTITIHSNHPGQKSIKLGQPCDVEELFVDRPLVWHGVSVIEFDMADIRTQVFRVRTARGLG